MRGIKRGLIRGGEKGSKGLRRWAGEEVEDRVREIDINIINNRFKRRGAFKITIRGENGVKDRLRSAGKGDNLDSIR